MESEEAVSDTLAFTPIMHYNLFSSIDKYVSQKNKGKEKEKSNFFNTFVLTRR